MKKTNIYARLAMTYLVMLIMLMQSVQAQTQTSTITIGDQKYMLYAGFFATRQADKSLVDNNLGTTWDVSFIYREGEVPDGVSYVEFQLDKAIVPRGCVLNYPNLDVVLSYWVLMAKCNPNDEWTTIVANPAYARALEVSCPCSNEDNQAYKYFRFEVTNGDLPSKLRDCDEECEPPMDEGAEPDCHLVCSFEFSTSISELRIYGNIYNPISAREATCTEVGIRQDCYVDADGKYYADADGNTELTDVEIPKLPHTVVHHQASGDCMEYWQCSVCNKYFKDEACSSEVEHVRIVKYLDDEGVLTELQDKSSIVTSDATLWTDGWYVVFDDVTISDRVTVRGDVRLILGNGATLTASRGITVEGDAIFSIYAQSDKENEMGTLIATASDFGDAGIGGASKSDAGAITINGGKINASGYGGAGIGSANYASVGTITINGGVVAAQILIQLGSSIGCGSHGCAEKINFNGGIVNAQGIGSDQFTGKACNIIVNITNGVKKIVANRIQYSSGCFGKPEDGTITINFLNNGAVVSGDDKDAVFLDFDGDEQRIIRSRTTNHTITLSDNIKNSVACSDEYALEGETITLTITGGDAIDVSSLKANGVAVAALGDNKYSFIMPDEDVTITSNRAETYSVNFPDGFVFVSASSAADAAGKYISNTKVSFRIKFPYTSLVNRIKNDNVSFADGIYSVTVLNSDITIEPELIESDTYTIENESNWRDFAESVSEGNTYNGKTVMLDADIKVDKKIGVVSSSEFTRAFSGVFDGKSRNIEVSITDEDNQGTALFCNISGASIRNVNMTGSVVGGQHAAGLVGFSSGENNLIENCVVSADVCGKNYVGGILGHGTSSIVTIDNCVFKGKISSKSANTTVGILLGCDDDGGSKKVKNCVYVQQDGQDIFGSFNLVKKLSNAVEVENCYSVGRKFPYGIEASTEAADGKICRAFKAVDNNLYYSVAYASVEGIESVFEYSLGVQHLPKPVVTFNGEVLQEGDAYDLTYSGVDDSEIGDYTVTVSGINGYSGSISIDYKVIQGLGSLSKDDNGVYLIKCPDDLEALATANNSGLDCSKKSFRLTTDINYTDKENNFTPIGNGKYPFKGSFDGGGYKITGINVNEKGSSETGFFGCLGTTGQVQNVILDGVRITGKVYVGGIVGYNMGRITGCIVANAVIQGNDRVGGIVGYNMGRITGCIVANAVIQGNDGVGGIAGYNEDRNISNSLVVGSDITGGCTIIGYQNGNTDCISRNYYNNCKIDDNAVSIDVGCSYLYYNYYDDQNYTEETKISDIPGAAEPIFAIELPDGFAANANPEPFMEYDGYLFCYNATEITFWAKTGYSISNVKANGTELTATEGVYSVTINNADIKVTADVLKPITHSDISIADIDKQPYTGSPIEIGDDLLIKDGETPLVKDKDFEVTYLTQYTNVGFATVRISGIGKYSGYRELVFEIIDNVIIDQGALTLTENQDGRKAVLDGNSDKGFNITKDYENVEVTLDRTFNAGTGYTSISLPFNLTSEQISGLGEFYTFESVSYDDKDSKWVASVSQVSAITAYKPYLFLPSANPAMTWTVTLQKTPQYYSDEEGQSGTIDDAFVTTSKENSDWQLVSVYNYKVWPDHNNSDYGFAGIDKGDDIKIGDFVHAGTGTFIRPFRSYLHYCGTDDPWSTSKSGIALPDRIEVRVINSVIEPDDPTINPSDPDGDIPTPTSEIQPVLDNVKVWSYDKTIFIQSRPGTDYRIIDATGRLLKEATTQSDRDEVRLGNHGGMVIVIIGSKAYKLSN